MTSILSRVVDQLEAVHRFAIETKVEDWPVHQRMSRRYGDCDVCALILEARSEQGA